tara:strand:- start:1130 stop:1393 length:264 start_codon:yes stop_codon:yes gene_type:complete
MRVTKRQLRRIIKEENVKVLNEQSVPSDYTDALFGEMSSIWEYYSSVPGLSPEERAAKTTADIEAVTQEFLAYMPVFSTQEQDNENY